MLQGEFQTLTGIFPDVLLYEAAEHEYNEGDWASKAEFCDCFKADEDGIAQKCQAAANARWFAAEELIGKLLAENSHLEDENENLRNEIAALSDRVDELMDEVRDITKKNVNTAVSKAKMMDSLLHAARDDCTGEEILHMIWGFEYMLTEMGVKQ